MPSPYNISNIADLYNEKTRLYGKSPEALSQGSGNKAHIRHAACTGLILADAESSVLDVGCGFGETLAYLRAAGWRGDYTGIDIAEAPLAIARDAFPGERFLQGDLEQCFGKGEKRFDYVLGIGCFTLKLAEGDSDAYYEGCVRQMFRLSRRACILGFMSAFVDYQKDRAWHAHPAAWYALGMEMTRAVTLHNYLPYEFALTLRHASVNGDNIFRYES